MSEENEKVTITKEVGKTKKARPLDEFETFEKKEDPAKVLVEGVSKEELKRMVEEPKPVGPITEDASEGALTLATPEEAKVLVEDFGKRYNIPPGFVLVFKDRRSGALSTYLTKNFYSALVERKGYSRPISYRPGARHNPDQHRYHYIASLVPLIPTRATRNLELLTTLIATAKNPEDAKEFREEFLRTWREWTKPVEEEGYASPDTVRMRTMKTDYNLDRLARTRAYRHLAALYCGISSAVEPDLVDEGEASEAGTVVVDANVTDTPSKGA